MKRIAVTGPESTGKSWLSEKLADYYEGVFVPEYAREYLEQLTGDYTPEDVIHIARGQHRNINHAIQQKEHTVVVADTELLVISIWLEHKYGIADPWVEAQLAKQPFDIYLLCDIDMPWQHDPLREHPHQREELMNKYLHKLKETGVSWYLVQGTGEERLRNAVQHIENHYTP